MAKYRVLAKSFINNSIVEEGEVVEYDGQPGSSLELIEPQAKPKAGKKGAAQPADSDAADASGASDLI